MENSIVKRYHFESTFKSYETKLINVIKDANKYRFFDEVMLTDIDIDNKTLKREDDEVRMCFNFNENIGELTLKNHCSTLPIEILNSSFLCVNENIIIDCEYKLGDEKVFVSLSLI